MRWIKGLSGPRGSVNAAGTPRALSAERTPRTTESSKAVDTAFVVAAGTGTTFAASTSNPASTTIAAAAIGPTGGVAACATCASIATISARTASAGRGHDARPTVAAFAARTADATNTAVPAVA